MQCVTASLAHCVNETRRPVEELYREILKKIRDKCPGPCDPVEGASCLLKLARSIISALIDPNSDCQRLQRSVAEVTSSYCKIHDNNVCPRGTVLIWCTVR